MSEGGERSALSIPSFEDDTADELDDFAPRRSARPRESRQAPKLAVDIASSFPSREASADGQLNLKGPSHILDRFRVMCKADRRPYYDMLEILMNAYENERR